MAYLYSKNIHDHIYDIMKSDVDTSVVFFENRMGKNNRIEFSKIYFDILFDMDDSRFSYSDIWLHYQYFRQGTQRYKLDISKQIDAKYEAMGFKRD